MSYNIVKSDGTPLATVADGQTNANAASITLIGKNYAGYGTFLNENFIKILENFSSPNAPLYPLVGQLWWKSDSRLLQIYDRFGNWKSISGAQSQSDQPLNAVAGDLWFDSVNQQLKVYSGAGWVVIGPSFTSTTGTSGAVADTVVDTSIFSHVVVKFFVQNSLVAILSKDAAFTPQTTIPGFSTIKPGFNLANNPAQPLLYYETANNAAYLGGIISSRYLTADAATVTSKLVVQNPAGIEIQELDGTVSDFEINVGSNNVNFIGKVRNYGMLFRVRPDNAGGTTITAMTIDKTTGLVLVDREPTTDRGVATKGYVDNTGETQKSWLISNVNIVNSSIDTLRTNVLIGSDGVLSTYSNVRLTQSHLGFNNPAVIGLPNNTFAANAYSRFTTNDTFAGNLLTLWANVSAIHSNVLSRPDVAGLTTGSGSIYSNVAFLQQTVASQGDNKLDRNGGLSVTGTLVPDTVNTRDLGSAGFRFKDFYSNTANVASIVHSGTTGTGDIGQTNNRFGTLFVSNLQAITGTSNIGELGASGNVTSARGFVTTGTSATSFIHTRGNITARAITVNGDGTAGNGDIVATGTIIASGLQSTGNVVTDADSRLTVRAISTGANGTVGTIQGDWRLFGTSRIQATYADLAERFAADAEYDEGTVLTIGGEFEVTQENAELSETVFGVVSRKYAYLMNGEAGADETHPAVALTGRVPVKAIGTVSKGDRLVSAGNGTARSAKANEATPFNTIGRALENKATEEVGLVIAIVTAK